MGSATVTGSPGRVCAVLMEELAVDERLGFFVNDDLAGCGVGGVIANAIYNASGVRVRDDAVTLDERHRTHATPLDA
jgi:hypothetical protein